MAVTAIATYTDLQNAVADYLIRTDLTSQIQLGIALAEFDFNRKIRNKRMEQRSTVTTIGGQPYTALPDDFLELRSMSLVQNPRVPLQYRTPQQLETLYGDQTSMQPEAFSIIDNEFKLAPTPDTGYVVEILYYESIPALSATNATNWLLTNHPDIYLFATILQVSVIIRDTEIGSAAAQFLSNGMQSLDTEGKLEQWASSSLVPTTDAWMR